MTNETLATLATAKVHKSKAVKAASSDLEVGTHAVDVLVRITGSLTRGEDFEQRIVGKADAWGLLAAALRGKDSREIAALVRDSLSGDLKGEIDRLKAEAAAAMLVLKGATLTPCNGKITTKLTAEVVEAEAVPA